MTQLFMSFKLQSWANKMHRVLKISNCKNTKENSNCIKISSPSLQDSVKKIIENEGYITYSVETRNFNSGGGSFLGELYEVDIKGETIEGAKETNIFIKQIITLNKIQLVSVKEAFCKEAFMYNNLSKIFACLQDQAGVPPGERFKIAKVYDQTNSEAIILDNLAKRNFKTYDRLQVPPLKYVQLAVKELAKFHGLSFVVENKIPEYFNKNIKPLQHPFCYDEDWNKLVTKECTYLANLYDNEIKTKIENFLPIFLEKFPKYGGYKTNIKCCLTHEDYRTNNVLVREHNGEPVEVIPIDYQLLDYGCPIRDFLFFIFSGTDQEFRRQHLNDLKELYFETLSRFLKYFDMDVESVYPRQEFDKVYTEWLDYGLMMVLFGSAFLYAPDTGLDMENLSLSELPFHPNKIFEDRLKGLIEDFVQWGYL